MQDRRAMITGLRFSVIRDAPSPDPNILVGNSRNDIYIVVHCYYLYNDHITSLRRVSISKV